MGAKIGDLIRFYRKQAGLSQEALGKGICSAKYIGQLERGENIPTLDIVDQISDKLKVNIYYAYSYAYKFPNIEAYKVALDINKALTVNDDDRLEKLYKKYSGTKDFQSGEAFLLMTYIESLFLADSKEYLKAAQVIENKFPEYKELCLEEEKRLSGVEQALVLSYAADMRNIGEKEKAQAILRAQIRRTINLLTNEYYEEESNKRPWISMLMSCILNLYISSDSIDDQLGEMIEMAISISREEKSTIRLPEIILCEATFLMTRGEVFEAKEKYRIAKEMFSFCYPKGCFEDKERQLINRFSDSKLFKD